ncbi:helix-turn-helix domain-containing protein [Pseudomonas protegens]|uniref:helix-turn-helix domain-containing protein n=1 Tax=Pseudomonas protegens TaxID=380021 RepID=UPI001C8D9B5D|nr:helix-turn-helix domain-containing protein [Pseudomonas protegens]QZI68866.1 helix-turn-helix domain-containing protein [Pseudomonas protegens]
MNAPAGLQHHESRIDTCVIRARQAHVLQRVPIFISALCRVRQGEKRMEWGDRQMRVGGQHLILLPAGREVGISNYPGAQGHYIADVVTFPAPALRAFSLRYRQQIITRPGRSGADLCVPLERHTALAWDNLLECIASDAPDALRSHYGEAVLLGLALQWLQTTPRPIGEIAAASGYASASRFAVRFRKHYGLSPRELRAAI